MHPERSRTLAQDFQALAIPEGLPQGESGRKDVIPVIDRQCPADATLNVKVMDDLQYPLFGHEDPQFNHAVEQGRTDDPEGFPKRFQRPGALILTRQVRRGQGMASCRVRRREWK